MLFTDNHHTMEATLTPAFKKFFGFEEDDSVIARRDGLIKINDGNFTPGHISGKVYAAIDLENGKTVRVNRIIYAAFHPDALYVYRRGCRINLIRPFRMREGTNMVRNYLEDLILEPLSLRPERPLMYDSEGIHPVGYGSIIYGVPLPMMWKDSTNRIIPVPNYMIELYENYATPFVMYHKDRQTPLRTTNDAIGVYLGGKAKTLQVHIIVIASAFPNIDTSIRNTVDHINNDPTDHRITNLQWLTRSENSAKSSQAERGGRPIMMLKRKADELVEVCRFKSQFEAARLIKKHLPNSGTLKCIGSKISRNNLHKPHYTPYNFVWRDVPMEIEGEEWKPLPAFLGVEIEAYEVSNKGRVRNIFGYLFRPVPNRYGKYNSVSLLVRRNSQETKRFYIHFLVFCAFNNRLPVGDVRHNDSAPLIDGYYRNYLEDLIDGSRSENMYDYSHAKRQRLIANGSGPSDNDVYDIEDVMSEKASVLFNENTFHERGWVFTDLEDEMRQKYQGDEERIQAEINKIRSSKILKLRRDYPFEMNYTKASGGKGCLYTTKAIIKDQELKGPSNHGYNANVKMVHMVYSYQMLTGNTIVAIEELVKELPADDVLNLDKLFYIRGARGPNIINVMLEEKGHLPVQGYFTSMLQSMK